MITRRLAFVACAAIAALGCGPTLAQTTILEQGPRAASESGALASNQDQEDYIGTAQQIADDFTLTSPARLTAVTWEGFYSGAAIPVGKTSIVFGVRLHGNLASAPLLDASCEATFEQIGLGDNGSPIYRFSTKLNECSHAGVRVPYIEVGAQTWIAIVDGDRDTTAEFRWFKVTDSLAGEFAFRPNESSSWQDQSGANLVLALQGVQPETSYRLTDLGTLGGATSFGIDLNESGQAAGYSKTAEDKDHAFLWDGTALQDLGTLGGESSNGFALNESGQVTGVSRTSDGLEHAFVWNGTGMVDLGTMGGRTSLGYSINDSGWVTGWAEVLSDEGDYPHAFLWNGSDMMDLGTLGRWESIGVALNDSGWVAGTAGSGGDYESAAFLWNGDSMLNLTSGKAAGQGSDINDLGWVTGCAWFGSEADHAFRWNGVSLVRIQTSGNASCGAAINESGWVIGSDSGGPGSRAWVWDGSVTVDLGDLGGQYSDARDINDLGDVTGDSATAGGYSHAFIWDGTAMWDLNDLIDTADPLRSYVTLQIGVRLNNQGQVLANGIDSRTGNYHAYLVSPVDAGSDGDGDGIADSVDSAPGTPSNGFNDNDGTSGSITDRAGLTVTIEDAASPDGVRVVVGVGSGQVSLDACGFTVTVNAASELIVACGSVTLSLIQGAAQIVLDDGRITVVSIPVGVTATVADNGDGTFLVQNVGGVGDVTVTVGGTQTTICPGGSQSYVVVYPFLGFFSPVDNLPTLNAAKAGSAIPVKFSLGVNQGLAIFAAGYPKTRKIYCSSAAPMDDIEETVTAGSSSLSYAADTGQYDYVWKTDKSWDGTCRQLILGLNDSTNHVANFKFK